MLTHLTQFHHASLQHDFTGKGEYNVLLGVSKEQYLLGCGFLFAFHSNYRRIFNHLWDIQR